MLKEEDLNAKPTRNWAQASAAYDDAMARSQRALDNCPELADQDHLARVDAVKAIADKFFRVKKGSYINHREGGGGRKSMSTVKIDKPTWVPGMQAAKQKEFIEPLTALGVKVIKSTTQGTIIEITP